MSNLADVNLNHKRDKILAKENMIQEVPAGVLKINLQTHHDERGCFTEIFREEWKTGIDLVQWNIVSSNPNTLRGFHVHLKHFDYLVLLKGTMLLGLKDLRAKSPTFGRSSIVTLSGDKLEGWMIPPGVGHGFFLPIESIHCYAVSEYWHLDDELCCLWNDPELELEWPVTKPLLSNKDKNAPTFEKLMETLQQHNFPEYW